MKRLSGLFVLIAFVAIGCSRHVVVHPDDVSSLEKGRWKISKEPVHPKFEEDRQK